MKTPRSWLTHYALSVAIVAVVIAIKSFVLRDWSLAHPYLSFYPAIILAGWYGGFGPGVLASLLAAVALAYLWLPPLYSLRIQDVQDASGLLLFVAIGFAISLLNEARLRADRRAAAAEAETRRAKQRQ
jgi:two-component system sensor histidine kinase/response regulator